MSGKFYAAAREGAQERAEEAPPLFELARRFEEHAKGMVVPGTHLRGVRLQLRRPDRRPRPRLADPHAGEPARQRKGPQFLHVVTKKGQGYKLAEADPVNYHGPGKFDPAVGLVKPATPPKTTFTQVFGQWLCDMAEADERLVGITPAMREGSGMVEFQKRFPKRYFDVGIAEQHAVTFAAGLACEGLKPVVAIYSTFLQRGYDQLIHDVAIQNLPVVFALDRAGLVGADGATHAGAYDIAYMRCMPNMSLLTPADENECRQALSHRLPRRTIRWPCATRAAPASAWRSSRAWTTCHGARASCGASDLARGGRAPRIAILAFGTLLYPALQAAERLDATVANMRFVKPLDVALVLRAGARARCAGHRRRGLRSWAAPAARWRSAWLRPGMAVPVLQLGLPDEFIEHGDPAKLLAAAAGWMRPGIEQSILSASAPSWRWCGRRRTFEAGELRGLTQPRQDAGRRNRRQWPPAAGEPQASSA